MPFRWWWWGVRSAGRQGAGQLVVTSAGGGGENSVADLVVKLGAEGPKVGFHGVEGGGLVPVADLPLPALVFVEQLIQDATTATREVELLGERISVSGEWTRARSLSRNRQPDSETHEEPGAGESGRPNTHVLHGLRSAPFLGRRRGLLALELEPLVFLLELQESLLEPLARVEVGDLGAAAPREDEGDGDEPAGGDGHEGA